MLYRSKTKSLIVLIEYILILLITIPFVLSAYELSFDDGIYLINPSEISLVSDNQIINFYSCTEKGLENKLLCEDDVRYYDLPNIKFGNCSLSYVDISSISCNQAYLVTFPGMQFKIDLMKIGSATKSFVLLNEQKSNGSFGDAADTALAIWSLSQFGDKYKTQIDSALNWLKLERNDQLKCWPKNGCDTFQTAKVLAYLTLADLKEGKRVINDAKNWIESKQNYMQSINNWQIGVVADQETNCSLKFGWNDLNFKVNKTVSYYKKIIMEYGLEFNLSCSSPVSFTIMTPNSELVYTSKSEYLRYKFSEGACWSSKQWGDCDLKTTIYGAMCDTDSGRKSMAREFLSKKLIVHPITGKYFPLLDSTIYHFPYYTYVNPENELKEYILFKQNNDGSYGESTDNYLTTLHAINSLLHMEQTSHVSEAIRDAKFWLLNNDINYENNESDKIEKISLSSSLFKDTSAKSELIVRPPIINFEGKDNIVLEFYNPSNKTMTNINFISNNDYISINSTSPLSAGERRNIPLSKKIKKGGIHFDVLSIIEKQNSSYEKVLFNIPILINNSFKTEITSVKEFIFVGSNGSLPLNIYSTVDSNCAVNNENEEIDILTKNLGININTTKGFIQFKVDRGPVRASSFNDVITIDCAPQNKLANNSYFILPIIFKQYTSKLFSVSPSSIVINKPAQKGKIQVKNRINENINLHLAFNKSEIFFEIPESLDLKPFEQKEIIIENKIGENQEYHGNNYLIITSKFQIEMIPFSAFISSSSQTTLRQIIIKILILIVPLFLFWLVYLFLKRFKDNLRPYYAPIIKKLYEWKDKISKQLFKKEEKGKNL